MPYRRLPKTDAARLKALKTLLDNNDIYTVRNRFVDWKLLNKAQQLYDRLLTACDQYRISKQVQARQSRRVNKLQRNATLYLSHFLQVLFMCVERGEIKNKQLQLYGLEPNAASLPDIKNAEALKEWGKKVVEGEKVRIKKGGCPIYNPTISMVFTHHDIFKEAHEQQQTLTAKTKKTQEEIVLLRPEVDEVLLDIWNQIEKHFENEPPEVRFPACRKLGVVYYYRRHEEHLYGE